MPLFNPPASSAAAAYKVYTALLSQAGEEDPTVVVLQNTLSGPVVWSRLAVGQYVGVLANAFPDGKTWFSIAATPTSVMFLSKGDTGHINILSNDGDDTLTNTSIEIRVFP